MADPSNQDMILGEMRGQLREVVHSVNNLSSKFDGLSREVIGLGPLASDIAELKGKVAILEQERSQRVGATSVIQTIVKSPVIAWLTSAVVAAWVVLTGKVQL